MKSSHLPSNKKHWFTITLLTLCTVCFSSAIYLLASSNIKDPDVLSNFSLQLFLLTACCYLLFVLIYFFFPYSRLTANKQHSTHQQSNHANKQNESIAILAVDDNPANLMVIESQLAGENITITQALSGLSAIELFKSYDFDIVFMDIEMEDMNGFEATQEIRLNEHDKRTPIIAVSAHDKETKKMHALTQGFDDYLGKPVNTQELQRIIARWTGQLNKPLSDSTIQTSEKTLSKPETSFYQTTKGLSQEAIKPVVDIKLSLERSNQNRSLAKDMLNLLIKMITEEGQKIEDFYQNKEWGKLYQLNHKIYGGSAYCGVPDLQKANQKLERLLQHVCHSDSDLENLLDKNSVKQAVDDVQTAIDDLLQWQNQYDIDLLFED